MDRKKLFDYALERYGTVPEYLWRSSPEHGVLRCDTNDKWYAIVMNVDGSKIGLEKGRKVDIVNVRCSPLMTGSLLAMNGIFPAYHMQKAQWVSVLLDDSADDEQVKALLDMSHELASRSGSGKKLRTVNKEWLVPASPVMYDVERDFRRDGTILWKQTSDVIAGDTVYMYMAAPLSAIMYRCEAVEVNIPYTYDNGDYHIRKVMKLKLIHRFAAEDMPLSEMRELGVAAVRGPRGVPDALLCRLRQLEKDG
ncbi:MmcQ/YjbR family DNA-binding protein [uncultured Ruminococcus sp.]|uniref:MmcQ/YjbR family DNA-binding protein n=1 Tax=uncultured Ruminococcus sp. TaxID=165186 RepID=UPI002626A1D8|nr:MmcQ/YjbR family DNA-binding protein [uncultured Ruminococcus sp.]